MEYFYLLYKLKIYENISLELKTPENRDSDLVETDKVRLNQILTKLIRNALKFTHEGFIKIHLDIKDKDVIICVEDSGIGIEQEKIDAIFNVSIVMLCRA